MNDITEGRRLAKKKIILKSLEYLVLKHLESANYLYAIMLKIKHEYHVNLSNGSLQNTLSILEKNGILTSKIEIRGGVNSPIFL